MLAERELRELLQFIAPEPVLSVYLNTDPSEGNKDAYRLRLRNLLKGVNLPEDVETVEGYFQREYDWTGRGVAVFSCAGQDFFRIYPLSVLVPDLVHVSDRPSVRILADLLDSFGGYGVVLVDKQGARVFSFHLGELQEQEGVLGEAVKRTKHGGASSLPGARGGVAGQTRHLEEVVERNMKDSVEFAVKFFENNRVRRILIGGTEDNVALFRGLLPKAWQSLIVGTFPMGMGVRHAEVLAKAMQVGQEAEQKREKLLVEELLTQAAKGSGAVIGLDDSLEAINSDRVSTLVISYGYQQPAYRCKNCGFLTVKPLKLCPVCNGKMSEVPDMVDLAINRTMRQGGDVEVLHANLEFDKAGKIGAFIRY
jgi:peptide chain release factor subunit 1